MKFYIYKDILNKFGDRVIITNETATSLYNLGDHHLDEYIDLYARESDKTIEKELIEEFKEYARWKFEITYLPDNVFDELETIEIELNGEMGGTLKVANPVIVVLGITKKFTDAIVRLEQSSFFRIIYEYWKRILNKISFKLIIKNKLSKNAADHFEREITEVDLLIRGWRYIL